MKFATRNLRSFLPHLDYVATLPWEVKSPNLLKITNATQKSYYFYNMSFKLTVSFFQNASSVSYLTCIQHTTKYTCLPLVVLVSGINAGFLSKTAEWCVIGLTLARQKNQ